MAKHRITIEVEGEDYKEALFNFGIGEPDPVDGEEWCNMRGIFYRVTSIQVEQIITAHFVD